MYALCSLYDVHVYCILVSQTKAYENIYFLLKFQRLHVILLWIDCAAGTRAFAASCCDQDLASRSDLFIQQHIAVIIERSQEFLQIPSIVVHIIGKWFCQLSVVS